MSEAVKCGLIFVLTAELWWYFWEVPGEGKEVPPILPCRASLALFPQHNSFSPVCSQQDGPIFVNFLSSLSFRPNPRPISYRHCQSSVRDRYRILLRICRTFFVNPNHRNISWEKKNSLDFCFRNNYETFQNRSIFFFVFFFKSRFQICCVCKSVKRERKMKKCHRPKHAS